MRTIIHQEPMRHSFSFSQEHVLAKGRVELGVDILIYLVVGLGSDIGVNGPYEFI